MIFLNIFIWQNKQNTLCKAVNHAQCWKNLYPLNHYRLWGCPYCCILLLGLEVCLRYSIGTNMSVSWWQKSDRNFWLTNCVLWIYSVSALLLRAKWRLFFPPLFKLILSGTSNLRNSFSYMMDGMLKFLIPHELWIIQLLLSKFAIACSTCIAWATDSQKKPVFCLLHYFLCDCIPVEPTLLTKVVLWSFNLKNSPFWWSLSEVDSQA